MRLTNQEILDRCAVQIRRDAATIEGLQKAAQIAARSAETHRRVSEIALAKARDASPIVITGREGRTSPFALPLAREMLRYPASTEHHLDRIGKAAKAAAPGPGHEVKKVLTDAGDRLKAAGFSDTHPLVQHLREHATNFGNTSDPDGADAEDVAKSIGEAVILLTTTPVAKTAQSYPTRFAPEAFIPGATGSTRRQIKGGFEQGGSGE